MLAKLRPRRSSHGTVVAYLALFVALGGTSAYAINEWTGANIVDESLTGADVQGKAGTTTAAAVNGSLTTHEVAGQQANSGNGTPFIDGTLTQWDVKNGSLTGGDLANNTVGGNKVTDNTLKGTDIDEASLGQVPSALLGGFGRWSGGSTCDPESEGFFVTCGVVTLNLPAPSRVLVTGALVAAADSSNIGASGDCRVATSLGSLPLSEVSVRVTASTAGVADVEPFAVTAITAPLGGGSVAFGVECKQGNSSVQGGMRFLDVQVSAVALSPN